jgi:hypothetical protein
MNWCENLYRASSLIGAVLIALNVGQNVTGYWLFLMSSILGGWLAYKSNASRSLVEVNVMFGIINIIGIVRYWHG